MAQQKVELRKVRDFSDNLNDTFLFIRQNLKPLLTSFLGISGVFMLAAAILSGLYQSNMGSVFKQIINGSTTTYDSPFYMIDGKYFWMLSFTWLNIIAMQVAIVSYMKVYEAKDGEVSSIDEVWQVFKSYFFKVLIYSIPILLLTVVGCFFCLLPGIYLAVVFVPFPAVVMMEDQSLGGAYNRCFTLVKDNFWVSFGLYLLVYIIYSFSSGIISMIIGAAAGLLFYFTTKDLGSTIGVVTSILSIFSFVFYIIYYVSVVLNYFNLSERFDGTGMMRKLETIGDSPQNFDNIQEQY
jgi:hypothetical protein